MVVHLRRVQSVLKLGVPTGGLVTSGGAWRLLSEGKEVWINMEERSSAGIFWWPGSIVGHILDRSEDKSTEDNHLRFMEPLISTLP